MPDVRPPASDVARPRPEAVRPRLVFVTGGARSGKSRFALTRAEADGGDAVTFIATAEALDAEMTDRIGRHRAERRPAWRTLEAPRDLPGALYTALAGPVCRVVVVDCLSLWVSNLMLDGLPEAEVVARAACLDPARRGPEPAQVGVPRNDVAQPDRAGTSGARTVEARTIGARTIIVVTNEVGLGIVPDNALARTYRDILGRVNQTVAAMSDEAYLLVAGLPLRVK